MESPVASFENLGLKSGDVSWIGSEAFLRVTVNGALHLVGADRQSALSAGVLCITPHEGLPTGRVTVPAGAWGDSAMSLDEETIMEPHLLLAARYRWMMLYADKRINRDPKKAVAMPLKIVLHALCHDSNWNVPWWLRPNLCPANARIMRNMGLTVPGNFKKGDK